jgi:hypothetical protein
MYIKKISSYTIECSSAIKKEENPAICSNMNGTRDNKRHRKTSIA